jgi:hypothetical protein
VSQQTNTTADLEPTHQYAGAPPGSRVDLEATAAYMKRAKADIHRSKAQAANRIALILVLGLVLGFPFYVLAIGIFQSEAAATHLERVFLRMYDVIGPLVGAVIGALFGLSFSERGREERV